MSRLGILTAVALIAATSSVRADNQVWTIGSWPGDIDLIPCSAWTKNSDGGWVLSGGSVKLGSETMANIGVKGDAAAHHLDRECGGQEEVTGRNESFIRGVDAQSANPSPRSDYRPEGIWRRLSRT